MTIKYKYNEDISIHELKEYIDKTYDEHYSKDKFQATEFIIDSGHGEGLLPKRPFKSVTLWNNSIT